MGKIIISTGDLQSRLDTWIGLDDSEASAVEDAGGEHASLHERPDLGTIYVPPSNEIEQAVTNVWQEMLGIDGLGVHDNFFDLGGNSLIGLKVISRLKKQLGVAIPVVALFEGPTVSALAKVISSKPEDAPSYEENRSRGEKRRERLAGRRKVMEQV